MLKLRENFQRIRFTRLFNGLPLFGSAHFVFTAANQVGGFAQFFLERGHIVAHDLGAFPGLADAINATGQFAMPAIKLVRGRFAVGIDFGNLQHQPGNLRRQSSPVVTQVVDLLFELHDLRVRFEHQCLRVGELIGLGVMILAQLVQRRLDFTQARRFAFKSGFGLDDLVGVAFFRGFYLALLGIRPEIFIEL